jgi:hypothetical protein
MNKTCIGITLILLLVIGGGAYKFLIQGSVTASSDGRLAILLTPGERDMVLGEMRSFLASVQQITQAISEDELDKAVEAAKKSGMAAQGAVPGSLIGKLPMEFKKLGFDTHSKFDQLAMDTKDLGDGSQTLSGLATLMQNCVACHAAYRIDAAAE